jgi:hypothetical protein
MPSKRRMSRHYRLTCRRCRRTWDAAYEVVAYHDLDGDRELFFLHGVPAAPPWSGIACPHCGGLRVSIVPAPAIGPAGGILRRGDHHDLRPDRTED